jgi:hypothetical protein
MKRKSNIKSPRQELTLVSWMAILFGFSALLIVGVMAYDRRDEFAFIDHMVDFHFNEEAVREACEREAAEAKDRERIKNEWIRELNSYDRDNDRGVGAAPDKDGGKR